MNKNCLNKLPDSGERQEFKTGAVRETASGKGSPSLISPELIFRLSKHLELGAKKYAPRNWESGFPFSRVMDSLLRHVFQYIAGDNAEDHLAAITCNVMFLMHFEKYHPELQDFPLRLEKITEEIQEKSNA